MSFLPIPTFSSHAFGDQYMRKDMPDELCFRLKLIPVCSHEPLGYPMYIHQTKHHVEYLRKLLKRCYEFKEVLHLRLYGKIVLSEEEDGITAGMFLSYMEQLDVIFHLLKKHIDRLQDYETTDPWFIPTEIRAEHGRLWLLFRLEELAPPDARLRRHTEEVLHRYFSPNFHWKTNPGDGAIDLLHRLFEEHQQRQDADSTLRWCFASILQTLC